MLSFASILLCLSLVGALTSSPLELKRSHATLLIERGILRGISLPENFQLEENLDLSGLRLKGVTLEAFDNVTGIKNLNLAGNYLGKLPEFVFINLTSLEQLSLANNKILDLENTLNGLTKLRKLDLSRNPLRRLRKGSFFGLSPKLVEIVVQGNNFSSIDSQVFENPLLREDRALEEEDEDDFPADLDYLDEYLRRQATKKQAQENEEIEEKSVSPEPEKGFQVCLNANARIASLEIVPLDQLSFGCQLLEPPAITSKLNLANLGIRGFEKNWNKLPETVAIGSLDLSGNEIEEIREEDVREFPRSFKHLAASKPTWKKFRNCTVPSVPFPETWLLKNSSREEIVKNGSGSTSLRFLNLGNNRLRSLSKNVFQSLGSLLELDLRRNRISSIEEGAFDGLQRLRILNISQNSLEDLPSGLFDHLRNLKILNLSSNRIRRISANSFTQLPKLKILLLNDNKIQQLEKNVFRESPKMKLYLNGNKIEKIQEEVFGSSKLRNLYLAGNKIEVLKNVPLKALTNLRKLDLSENEIAEIPENSFLGNSGLKEIKISKNPFEILENGAFTGICDDAMIYVEGNNIRVIKGGLFGEMEV